MSGPHLDDEALSAVLDGEAGAADLDHAESCEECASKLAAWRDAVSLLKAEPAPAVADARRTEAIEAALAALEAPAVSNLAERRRRRTAALNRGRLAAAAAAVAAVAGLAVGATQLSTGGSPRANTASRAPATTLPQPIAGAVASGAANGAPPGAGVAVPGSPQSSVASPLADLGNVSAVGQIGRLLRVELGRTPKASAQYSSDQTSPACASPARKGAGAPGGSVPVVEATLTYQGRPYLASVFPGMAKGTYVYAVVADPGCSLLTRGSFS